jgi:hypothetical protein
VLWQKLFQGTYLGSSRPGNSCVCSPCMIGIRTLAFGKICINFIRRFYLGLFFFSYWRHFAVCVCFVVLAAGQLDVARTRFCPGESLYSFYCHDLRRSHALLTIQRKTKACRDISLLLVTGRVVNVAPLMNAMMIMNNAQSPATVLRHRKYGTRFVGKCVVCVDIQGLTSTHTHTHTHTHIHTHIHAHTHSYLRSHE